MKLSHQNVQSRNSVVVTRGAYKIEYNSSRGATSILVIRNLFHIRTRNINKGKQIMLYNLESLNRITNASLSARTRIVQSLHTQGCVQQIYMYINITSQRVCCGSFIRPLKRIARVAPYINGERIAQRHYWYDHLTEQTIKTFENRTLDCRLVLRLKI